VSGSYPQPEPATLFPSGPARKVLNLSRLRRTVASAGSGSEHTMWRLRLTPLRRFVRTETGSAAVLTAAAIVALVWANLGSSYEAIWDTPVAVTVGGEGIHLSLREWINSGLMTFFFFVIGLEARREFDLGELRERRRLVQPVLAGAGGMFVAVAGYLAFNVGGSSASGWAVAMSGDTALALGFLAVAAPDAPQRLRAFVLTLLVFDEFVALALIAPAYSDDLHPTALACAAACLAMIAALRRLRSRSGVPAVLLAAAGWVALLESGVEPVVLGLAVGLLYGARPVGSRELRRAVEHVRGFREQPTPQLERSAHRGLRAAIPQNERLLALYQPWTSYVIVPVFALSNAGLAVDSDLLRRALGSPVTIGILLGHVVGKPLGILGVSLAVTRLSGGRLRPPVGWAGVISAGTIAGIGFTVSLLLAGVIFTGGRLDEAKLGVLGAAALAPALTWTVIRVTRLLPTPHRIRALVGGAPPLLDLAYEVDPARDHIRGPVDAPVTVVEYGDFECPFCGRAEPHVRDVLRTFAEVRYVWRHLPLSDVHLHAEMAADAAEAAAAQGAFWPMHDVLLAHQDELETADLIGYAEQLGLDVERFAADLDACLGAPRIAEDVAGADLSGVNGTPTFFVNGRRHYGPYDVTSLSAAIRATEAHRHIDSSEVRQDSRAA
jgi:Na+/H+ antiporter NhaA